MSSIRSDASLKDNWKAALANDGKVDSKEKDLILQYAVADGVTDQEIKDLETGLKDHVDKTDLSNRFEQVFQSDAWHKKADGVIETQKNAGELRQGLWRAKAMGPLPKTSTLPKGQEAKVAAYKAHYATALGNLEAKGLLSKPRGAKDAKLFEKDMARLGAAIDAQLGPDHPDRAEALAGAYAALTDRYFKHPGGDVDYKGEVTTKKLFALGKDGSGRFKCDCEGFQKIAKLFFSNVDGKFSVANHMTKGHAMGRFEVGNKAIITSNERAFMTSADDAYNTKTLDQITDRTVNGN